MEEGVSEGGQGPNDRGDLAIVLSGGGARAAYQTGFLRFLARRYPNLQFEIITGVSSGGINAVHLASHKGSFRDAVTELTDLWLSLRIEDVFRVDTLSLAGNAGRWVVRLLSGGTPVAPRVRGLVDTAPLRTLLERTLGTVDGEITGIGHNIEAGKLRAFALSAIDYASGQTVTWIQGRDLPAWERPNRRAVRTHITVDHVLASASLPIFFPAVKVGGSWFGDGGVRQSAPLSPAIRLGASRILAVSTRADRSPHHSAGRPAGSYPVPAQLVGVLFDAVFLDALEEDTGRVRRVSRLLERLPREEWNGLHPVEVLLLRPARDLGRLAYDYEARLPRGFRFLTRGSGTKEGGSDALSLIMFQPDYMAHLIELGESDAEARAAEIDAFLGGPSTPGVESNGSS